MKRRWCIRQERRLSFSLLVVLIACTVARAAPPENTPIFPAGGQRGQKVDATWSGKFPTWPVAVWTSEPGIKAKAGEKAGQIILEIAADARPGLHWLRATDPSGAAAPRPFVVGTFPELIEQETNDLPAAPMKVDQLPVVLNGRLAKSGDVDGYAVDLKEGQMLVAALEAETIGSPMDAVLQVCDSAGFVLAENHDLVGLDPRVTFTAPRAGLYVVRTFAFPSDPNSSIQFSGGDAYVYRLTLTAGPYVDYVFPTVIPCGKTAQVESIGWNIPVDAKKWDVPAADQPGRVFLSRKDSAGLPTVLATADAVVVEVESLEAALAVGAPFIASGRIGVPGDVDLFRVRAKKGERLNVVAQGRGIGSSIDASLQVQDASGKVLATADDVGKDPDPKLVFTAPTDGEFTIRVTDIFQSGGPRHFYQLEVSAPRPSFTLAADKHAYQLKPGDKVEIPLTIERIDGYDREIRLSAAGLPKGVTADAVKSEAKGATAKSAKLVIRAEKGVAFSGPIAVQGTSDQGGSSVSATAAVPGVDRTIETLWLTIAP